MSAVTSSSAGNMQFPESVYIHLRSIAAAMLAHERAGHTLQPTALAHEAFLRLAEQRELRDAPRERLVALGALMIRRILLDHYRHKHALKRGGRAKRIDLHAELAVAPEELLSLDEALCKLEKLDPERAELVTLRFFGGLSIEQIAQLRGRSSRTIAREWAFARAWLGKELAS